MCASLTLWKPLFSVRLPVSCTLIAFSFSVCPYVLFFALVVKKTSLVSITVPITQSKKSWKADFICIHPELNNSFAVQNLTPHSPGSSPNPVCVQTMPSSSYQIHDFTSHSHTFHNSSPRFPRVICRSAWCLLHSNFNSNYILPQFHHPSKIPVPTYRGS